MSTPNKSELAARIERQLLTLGESRVDLGLPPSVDDPIIALARQALVELARQRLNESEPEIQHVKIEFQY